MFFARDPLRGLRVVARVQILLDEWTDFHPPSPDTAAAQADLNEIYATFGLNRRTVKSLV